MLGAKIIRGIKNISATEPKRENLDPAIKDYFNHFIKDPLTEGLDKKWAAYPHRAYDLVKLGQFEYVSLRHTAKKITKIFIDYFKPYKSVHQLIQDYKQPLVGINNLFVGLLKIIAGLFTFNFPRLGDGLFSASRGIIELVTTPLTWLIKPLTRGLATLIHGEFKKIEDNKGMEKLAQYGQEYLKNINVDIPSNWASYELLAVCNDLHRKFVKSLERGQQTELAMEEFVIYSEIRSDYKLVPEKLIQYFSLFSSKKENLKSLSANSCHFQKTSSMDTQP